MLFEKRIIYLKNVPLFALISLGRCIHTILFKEKMSQHVLLSVDGSTYRHKQEDRDSLSMFAETLWTYIGAS